MRYLCVHCDHRFDHDEESNPRRCPSCMRTGGLEPLDEVKAKGKKAKKSAKGPAVEERPRWLLPSVGVLVVAALGGGYFYWARSTPDTVGDEVPMRPLERTELQGHVRRVSADVPEDALGLFDADDALESFAERAAGDESGPVARARAITAAIQARATKRGFIVWPTSSPRDTPVMSAARAYDAMSDDNARAKLYPLEVALVAASALRSLDVPAMLVEIYAFPRDRSPPDPSGHLGYYGIAVWSGEPGHGEPEIFDPYGGHRTKPAEDDRRVLDDLAVLGAFMNHQALQVLVHEGDAPRAFDLSEAALALDRRGPAIRSARGAVLIVSGGADEGMAELEAAAQLHRDAPRLNNLAGLALAKQDYEAASRDIGRALELHPDFAGGHATRAALHLAASETELADRELSRAEELDPDLPILPMLRANYYMATYDLPRAADSAMEAIRRKPHDWQTRLGAAQVLRAASRFDEMRRQAHAIMEMVPSAQREQIRRLIEQVLGPTALEDVDEDLGDLEEGEGEGEGLPSADFSLHGGSLLGEGEAEGEGGPTLGEGEGGEPLLNLGDQSKLRLGGGEEQLQLDLSE